MRIGIKKEVINGIDVDILTHSEPFYCASGTVGSKNINIMTPSEAEPFTGKAMASPLFSWGIGFTTFDELMEEIEKEGYVVPEKE